MNTGAGLPLAGVVSANAGVVGANAGSGDAKPGANTLTAGAALTGAAKDGASNSWLGGLAAGSGLGSSAMAEVLA